MTDLVVLDTDVVSYLLKGDTRAIRYLPHLRGRAPIISFVTLAELDLWSETAGWGARRRADLAKHVARYDVYFADARLCRLWATVIAGARRVGRTINANDAWIAATALRYNTPLMTHNAADYAGIAGLTLITKP